MRVSEYTSLGSMQASLPARAQAEEREQESVEHKDRGIGRNGEHPRPPGFRPRRAPADRDCERCDDQDNRWRPQPARQITVVVEQDAERTRDPRKGGSGAGGRGGSGELVAGEMQGYLRPLRAAEAMVYGWSWKILFTIFHPSGIL